MWLYVFAFIGAGLGAGFLGGLFGIGGGVLLIPIFIFLFGHFGIPNEVVMHLAVGTSLALVGPTSLAASWKQWRLGNLNTAYFRTWAIAIAVGVIIGSIALPFFTTRILESCFIGVLLLSALYIAFAKDSWVLGRTLPQGILKSVLALLVGFWSSLLGLGGGVLTTPILRLYHSPLIRAIALASATGVVVGVGGALGAIFMGWGKTGLPSWAWGYVDIIVFAVMLPTVMVMAPVGARVANRIQGLPLRVLYALFLFGMAAYMAFEALNG